MFLVEGPDKVLHYMEPIDIENGEYLCWDTKGKAVRICFTGNRTPTIDHDTAEMSLSDAFKRHADALGLAVDTTGRADEVWRRLKEAEAQLPRKRSLLSRVFDKNRL